jgi:hypothetical protein
VIGAGPPVPITLLNVESSTRRIERVLSPSFELEMMEAEDRQYARFRFLVPREAESEDAVEASNDCLLWCREFQRNRGFLHSRFAQLDPVNYDF